MRRPRGRPRRVPSPGRHPLRRAPARRPTTSLPRSCPGRCGAVLPPTPSAAGSPRWPPATTSPATGSSDSSPRTGLPGSPARASCTTRRRSPRRPPARGTGTAPEAAYVDHRDLRPAQSSRRDPQDLPGLRRRERLEHRMERRFQRDQQRHPHRLGLRRLPRLVQHHRARLDPGGLASGRRDLRTLRRRRDHR